MTGGGEHALVFSQYIDAQFGVAAVARAAQPLDPLMFTGPIPPSARRPVTLFEADPRQRV